MKIPLINYFNRKKSYLKTTIKYLIIKRKQKLIKKM